MNKSIDFSNFSVINLERKFVWNNNSEIVQLLLCAQKQKYLFCNTVKIRPLNGSLILYTKSLCNKVRNSDGYIWQKKNHRKTARENQILFKVNGVECLLAKYTRSAVLPSFQRRCYFLRQNPNVVLFHYLNVPSFTPDYKLCISTSTLLESDLQGINEIILFEQLTSMFDNFPTEISKIDGCGVVYLDIQNIIRAIVQSIIFQKQKKINLVTQTSNNCYVFSTTTDHRTVPKISHSLSSISRSSVGSETRSINPDKKKFHSNKTLKLRDNFSGSNNWCQARQSDSCIDTALGNREMVNLSEEDYFLSRANSSKQISLIDYRSYNRDLIISSSSNQSKKSINGNLGDQGVDSQTSMSSNNISDAFNPDQVMIIEGDTIMNMDSNINDTNIDPQIYLDTFDINDYAYWADIEGSLDMDISCQSNSEPIIESFDISGDFNFDYLSSFQPDIIPRSDTPSLSGDSFKLNITISHYAPSWSPLKGGGSILIAGIGISEDLFKQQNCNVLFGIKSVPAVIVQSGLLKAEIPAQNTTGEVAVKIQVGSLTTGPLIMFKYIDVTYTESNLLSDTNELFNIHQVIQNWIFQSDSELKVIIVEQMSLLEEEIMKAKIIPNSSFDLKPNDIIENISVDMIRVRRWCCKDSLELVLSRCCFTWCRRALSNLSKQISPDLPTSGRSEHSSVSVEDSFQSNVIDLSLVHVAAGLGYIEFLRLFLIWHILHLRQIRLYNSNDIKEESNLQYSLEKIELISGINDDSTDKNGFSALMWSGLRDHNHVLRLLAMWSPKMIMTRHKLTGLTLVEILRLTNKSHMISSIADIIARCNDADGNFVSPPNGQIDALWECMACTSGSDFDELGDIDDILKLGADYYTDEISSNASNADSRTDIAQNSSDSSKVQSFEDLEGVNQNEVQMVCLAGRIIQAMPIRIKQNPSSVKNDDIPYNETLTENIWKESHRQNSSFRPFLNRNRSSSHSSFSSTGADGANCNFGFTRLSNGRHTTDDSGISTPFDDSRFVKQSPNRDFNFDSPSPTTAEIADHFNAPTCFMEADFSRLTLSDQEQKRLYEAAKLIQNCYRRYRHEKSREKVRGTSKSLLDCNLEEFPCKKVFVKSSKASFQSKLQYIVNKVQLVNHYDKSRKNHNLSNVDESGQKFLNKIVAKRRLSSQNEKEVETDCQKEIEAAIIIQSYYRRYKQFAYYKRMCQAAVLIQNQFRWYVEHKKSNSDHTQCQIINNDSNGMTGNQDYRNYCKKHNNTLPNTLGVPNIDQPTSDLACCLQKVTPHSTHSDNECHNWM